METLAAVWESNVKSSATLLAVAALKRYGLLDEIEGVEGRSFRLSQTALSLILGQPDGPEWAGIVKQAALTPTIYADIWQHFGGELPSDIAIRQYLLLEKKFGDTAVDALIRSFRDTISFAKISSSDKITTVGPESGGEIENENEAMATLAREPESKPSAQSVSPLVSNPPSGTVVLREFTFPLSTGMAALKVPFPLTEQDYSGLIKTLETFKEGLVRKPEPPTLDCTSNDWEESARALAELGVEFNLSNFSYAHDIGPAKQIATANNLSLRLDIGKNVALLRRRQAQS